MQRQEQVCLGRLSPCHPFAQRHEAVGAAREQHPITAASQQFLLQVAGDGHDDRFFLCAAQSQRAGVSASVAGIEENQLGPGQRCRLPDRLGRGRVCPGIAAAKSGETGQPGEQIAAMKGGHGWMQNLS